MKEKLIELLADFWGVDPAYYDVDAPALADHLIANGVVVSKMETTTQQWIPVTERLPGMECLACAARNGEMMIGRVVPSAIGWCCESAVTETLLGVTHWMPLPEAPKGDLV